MLGGFLRAARKNKNKKRELPRIFWQPVTYSDATEKLKEETRKQLEEHIVNYRAKSEKELEEMVKKYEERVKQKEKTVEGENVAADEDEKDEEDKSDSEKEAE